MCVDMDYVVEGVTTGEQNFTEIKAFETYIFFANCEVDEVTFRESTKNYSSLMSSRENGKLTILRGSPKREQVGTTF